MRQAFELSIEWVDEGLIHITKGYSRDNAPELNQVALQLICAHKSSIPLWIEALSGNSIDQKSFRETVKEFRTFSGWRYLLSSPLQTGHRFLRHPLPVYLSAHLAARFPLREKYRLTTFRTITKRKG